MHRVIRKLWRRPWADWWMLVRAVVWTLVIRGSLTMFSLRSVMHTLRALAVKFQGSRPPVDPEYRNRAAWAANAAGYRFLPERPCLTQALVLQYLLLRRGDDSTELKIGVTKSEDGDLRAHAWVERGGRVLIGGTASPWKYRQLDGLSEKISQGR